MEHGCNGTDRGNRNTHRKPVPAPLCPPEIPYNGLESNTGHHGDRMATNPPNQGMVRVKEFKQAVKKGPYEGHLLLL